MNTQAPRSYSHTPLPTIVVFVLATILIGAGVHFFSVKNEEVAPVSGVASSTEETITPEEKVNYYVVFTFQSPAGAGTIGTTIAVDRPISSPADILSLRKYIIDQNAGVPTEVVILNFIRL